MRRRTQCLYFKDRRLLGDEEEDAVFLGQHITSLRHNLNFILMVKHFVLYFLLLGRNALFVNGQLKEISIRGIITFLNRGGESLLIRAAQFPHLGCGN